MIRLTSSRRIVGAALVNQRVGSQLARQPSFYSGGAASSRNIASNTRVALVSSTSESGWVWRGHRMREIWMRFIARASFGVDAAAICRSCDCWNAAVQHFRPKLAAVNSTTLWRIWLLFGPLRSGRPKMRNTPER